MLDWNMATPGRVVAGRGSIASLPRVLEGMGLRRPFAVIDPGVARCDFGGRAAEILAVGAADSFDNFGTNPTFSHVGAGLSAFRRGEYDCIVAVGGGSAIDLAKVIGLVAANGGSAEEYFRGGAARVAPAPLIAVPTTCGTGAESSPFAVILDADTPRKRGLESPLLMPRAAIIDPESLLSLSRTTAVATGVDALAHLLESHISRRATVLTRVVSRGLLCSIRGSLESAASETSLAALEALQAIAFTARLLYPRTGLSVAHALSHPLGAFTNIHHGLAVATFLVASVEFNEPSCRDAIADAEGAMGFRPGGRILLDWIDSIVRESGIAGEISGVLSAYAKLPVEKIAAEALQSSNIPSNPREIGLEETCGIVRASFARFGGGNGS